MIDFRITERSGEPIARLVDFSGGQVEKPLNDARMAQVVVNMKSKAVLYTKPLKYMLKVVWNQHLIFWGPITGGPKNYTDGTVTIQAHDPSWWWKFNFHRYGDDALDPYPVNGAGLRTMAKSALVSTAQHNRGVQHPGIWLPGYDDTPDAGTMPADRSDTDHNPDENGVYWSDGRERGEQVFSSVQDLVSTVVDLDWDIRPIDSEHLTEQVTSWPHGYMGQLDTYEKKGLDLTQTNTSPAFHYGWGADTLAGFQELPDASVVRNYAVTVEQSGTKDQAEQATAEAGYHNEASWLELGIMQGWYTGSANDTLPQLEARSKAIVQAYADTPVAFEMTPKPDRPDAPQWLRDFDTGDVIQAVAKRDLCVTDVKGRIVKVTVNQTNAAGGTAVTAECVPDIDLSSLGDGT